MIIPLLAAALVATTPTARFALIVTYNGGPELSRPPLHYADDDGAKYFEVFAALDKPQNVELLTEFDDDSARLFPALSKLARPPTLDGVKEAAAALAERVRAAKKQGYATELTFVFAGHGDVDGGKGFVSLKGSPLDGDGLTGLIESVGADRSHVILDSCNSFFVMSPRGRGRRFATPADLSDRLTRQLPNVGLFLSTNAEAEVFEWSELQSGVFSHAVRSGLLGAADANGDGVVSYEELAAFVDVATKDVKNPLFRPKVFARGPGGDNASGLANGSQGDTVPLTVDDPGDLRLSIRDAQGLRWIDAHKQAGATLVLRLPAFLAAQGTVERMPPDGRGPRTTVLLADPTGAPIDLKALGEGGPSLSARGDSELLRDLWDSPFGPQAVAEWKKAQAAQPAPVFGIDSNEKLRMRLLLTEISQAGRQNRLRGAVAYFLAGVAMGGFGGLLASSTGDPGQRALTLGLTLPFAVGFAIPGVVLLARPSDEEKAYLEFASVLDDPKADPSQVVANTTAALEEIADHDRHTRKTARILGAAITGLGGALLAVELSRPDAQVTQTNRQTMAGLAGLAIISGAFTFVMSFVEQTPTEQLVRLWRQDPDRLQLTGLGVAPTIDGKGATLVLGGRF